jgi:hypothetical protein
MAGRMEQGDHTRASCCFGDILLAKLDERDMIIQCSNAGSAGYAGIAADAEYRSARKSAERD